MSTRLGLDFAQVQPGPIIVVESSRRLRPEKSYGYTNACWLFEFSDGCRVASVPPGTRPAVERIVATADATGLPYTLVHELKPLVDDALIGSGLQPTNRVLHDLSFACNADSLIRHTHGDCRRIRDADQPAAVGLTLPRHCLPDGLVYGIVEDGYVASVAYAHRTHLMEDQIVDIGVETAETYRRRGYAKTAVSALTDHVTRMGGEAFYCCAPDNMASAVTARSVGFAPYGQGIILAASAHQ